MHIFEFLIPLTLFIATAFVIYSVIRSRHLERMAMIEKGFNPADLNLKIKDQSPDKNVTGKHKGVGLNSLKWGLLFAFIGIGILIGEFFHNYFGMPHEPATFGSMFIAGGLALILFYIIAAKKMKEKEIDEK